MIRFALTCDQGHGFESWFPSSASFDDQQARTLIACPFCSSTTVSKALMTPQVARSDRADATAPVASISAEQAELRNKIRALRDEVMRNADDVGDAFPAEARRIHYGESPQRSIIGRASLKDAVELRDEGVEVMPLPPLPDDAN